jgi:hypothetical protein
MEKTSTFFDETIHIMLAYVVHLHGHRNKVVPLMKLSILVDFNNDIKFQNCAPIGQLMIFAAIVFCGKSLTTTLVIKA